MLGYSALVGIDWGDQKHAVCAQFDGEPAVDRELAQTPEAISEWAEQLRARVGTGRVAVCLEQTRGALIYALMKYEFIVLYPVNPSKLASYRGALCTSGAKRDVTDAQLCLDYLQRHGDQLNPWRPDDVATRTIGLLVEERRQAIDDRTRLTNRLKSALKTYYPQAISLFDGNLATRTAADLLLKWSSLQELMAARPAAIRQFFHVHNCRRPDVIQRRLDLVRQATPLTTDPAVLEWGALTVARLAKQLRCLLDSIGRLEERLEELVGEHPDAELFASFPGAGPTFTPRLIVAFGTDRERMATAEEIQTLSGIAPVTVQTGKSSGHVRRRWACPKFLRQTFHEHAGLSIPHCKWAKAYYDIQRERGKSHHAAVRALAFKWQRIMFRCWQTRTKYVEADYLQALERTNSPVWCRMVEDRRHTVEN